MPYSYQTTIPATSTSGPFYFTAIDGYLSLSHLTVYVNDALIPSTQYTIDVASKSITFTTPVGAGSIVKIKRTTPKTVSGRVVDFNDASVLTAANLDDSALQNLFISQEAEDTGTSALPPSVDGSAWDAGNRRILNVGSPLSGTDAANRAYVDTAVLGQGPWTSPQAWTFTGDGTTTYSWTTAGQQSPNSQDVNSFIVEVGGVIQHPVTNYTINTNAIVFTAAVPNSVGIKVRNFGISASLPTWDQTTTFTQPTTFNQTISVSGQAVVDGIPINNSAGDDASSIYMGSGGTLQQSGSKRNTVVGQQSGTDITSATENTIIGYNSADNISTGGFNTVCGANALRSALLSSGSTNNVAIGYSAGNSQNNATVTNGIYIGSSAAVSGSGTFTRTNEIVIGKSVTGDGSNTTRIGTSTTTQTTLAGNLITTGTGTSTIGGALEVNGNITLKAGGTGALAANLMPIGSVVQVVHASSVSNTTLATVGSFVDCSISASITPTKTTSKILILANVTTNVGGNVATAVTARFARSIGGAAYTTVTNSEHANLGYGTATANIQRGSHSMISFDSPGTTSSITYRIEAARAGVAGGTCEVGAASTSTGASRHNIVLVEIA
jgi:hypothetical protein